MPPAPESPVPGAAVGELAWQGVLPLHGATGGGTEPDWSAHRRIVLAGGAWVDVVTGWLADTDGLAAGLIAGLRWRADVRRMYDRVVAVPRLTAPLDDAAMARFPELGAIRDALCHRYGAGFGRGFANLYRDGADSVAWHGDRVLRDLPEATVAVLTLGAARPFLLRPRGGGRSVRLVPAAGDLIVMGGSCQATWEHCVPKTARPTGARLSVSFRRVPDRPVDDLPGVDGRSRPGTGPRPVQGT